MPQRCPFFLFSAFLVLALFTNAGQAFALSVDDVRFGVHTDKTRLVLDLSEATEFRIFALQNPYRMVVDLPAFDWRASPINKPEHTTVTAVRHGNLQPGISRIVFDINKPIDIHTAFILPGKAGGKSRLVIDFETTSEPLFNKNKIFGNLKESGLHEPYQTASIGSMAPPPPSKIVKPLIIIDAGHGGIDPGAPGANGVQEKVVTLALAQELKKQLLASGRYRVKMTRETNIFIKLAGRVQFAREHEGDLFISLHADSMENSSVHGASIYTLSEKASDAQTEKLAARENRADLVAGIDLSVEDKDVANILLDLAMRDTMNQSKFFANTLVDTFKSHNLKMLERPHRSAGFAVLKAPDIPSVLVEAGFMSSRKESDMLNSTAHRQKLAKALQAGIDLYFDQVRKNQRI